MGTIKSGQLALSVRDAAELLGVDRRVVTRELTLNGGTLPAKRMGPKRIVISRLELEAWLRHAQ